MLLVVVENLLDREDSRVLSGLVSLAGLGLEPVHDSADEGRDEGDASLGASDGLTETEEEGEVAMDVELLLEVSSGLNSLPGGGDLDEDSVLGDTDGLVESDQGLGLADETFSSQSRSAGGEEVLTRKQNKKKKQEKGVPWRWWPPCRRRVGRQPRWKLGRG